MERGLTGSAICRQVGGSGSGLGEDILPPDRGNRNSTTKMGCFIRVIHYIPIVQ